VAPLLDIAHSLLPHSPTRLPLRRASVDETHELARRQQEKNKAFLQAAGLREVNEGDAFNRELQEQRKLERAVARQQAEQEREERKQQQEKERKRREKEARKDAERREKEREVGFWVLQAAGCGILAAVPCAA
jgi:hypothetical protein